MLTRPHFIKGDTYVPQVKQRVELVRHTADGEALTALAAKLCYAGGDLTSLQERIREQRPARLYPQGARDGP